MDFIQVRASNPGFPGRWRAGRFFANGATVKLEIVPDPTSTDANGKVTTTPYAHDQPKIKQGDDWVSDPLRVSLAGVAEIKGDPMLSVLEGGEAQVAGADVVIGELRAQLATAQAELSAAKVRIAELEAKAAVASTPVVSPPTETTTVDPNADKTKTKSK